MVEKVKIENISWVSKKIEQSRRQYSILHIWSMFIFCKEMDTLFINQNKWTTILNLQCGQFSWIENKEKLTRLYAQMYTNLDDYPPYSETLSKFLRQN